MRSNKQWPTCEYIEIRCTRTGVTERKEILFGI